MNRHPGLRAFLILLLLIFSLELDQGQSLATPTVDSEELKAKLQAAVCTVTENICPLRGGELFFCPPSVPEILTRNFYFLLYKQKKALDS